MKTVGRTGLRAALFCCALMILSQSTSAADKPAATGIAARTVGLARTEGFIPFYWDAGKGRVLLLLSLFDQDVLYYVSAASGAGSVEMPLDRGILNSSVVHFQRSGPKVLVIQQNLKFRANGGTDLQATNVRESFASSRARLAARRGGRGRQGAGRCDFLVHARRGRCIRRSRAIESGRFRFDPERSGFYPARMKAFPDNTEIETVATFGVESPGPVVRNVVPDTGS